MRGSSKKNSSFTHILQVEGLFYVNDGLKNLMYEELRHHSASQGRNIYTQNLSYYVLLLFAGVGGFLPAVKQISNVAALPGIVGVREIKYPLQLALSTFSCIRGPLVCQIFIRGTVLPLETQRRLTLLILQLLYLQVHVYLKIISYTEKPMLCYLGGTQLNPRIV